MNDASSTIARWREDPRTFVRECLGATPDAWQDDTLAAFPTSRRMALKACKGPGKSTVLAWLVWNFLVTRPHPKIACTSVSGDNLRDCLWSEVAKWQHRSELLRSTFTWSAERISSNEHPQTWWASARTWSRSADPGQQAETLAGLHADHLLFVIDEAGGVPDAVAAAADAGLSTGGDARFVIAGNPAEHSGPLYRACTSERSLWWIQEISGDPDNPKRSPRISVEWAREQILKYGREHPWVRTNVMGEFPDVANSGLIGLESVTQAMRRNAEGYGIEWSPKILGVDVARFGDDRTVLFPRRGLQAYEPVVMRSADTMAVAGRVARAIMDWAPDAVFIDQTGVGSGVVDRLRELGHPVIGVDAAGQPNDRGYKNKRAEMWGEIRDWLREGGALPNLPELASELSGPSYRYDSSGRLLLESKDDIKKSGRPSPDLADALALTFAYPVASRVHEGVVAAQASRHQDRDPYEAGAS